MTVQRTLTISAFTCLVYFLSYSPCAETKFFSYAPAATPDKPCILLDTNLTIDIAAFDNATGEMLAHVARTSDDQNLTTSGSSCSEQTLSQLVLDFPDGGSYEYNMYIETGTTEVRLAPTFSFDPSRVFGSVVPESYNVTFMTWYKGVGTEDKSYLCQSPDFREYFARKAVQGNFTFGVNVTVNGIHMQGFNVANGTFSEPYLCEEDRTTTPTPSTRTPSSGPTTEPSSTPTRPTGSTASQSTPGASSNNKPTNWLLSSAALVGVLYIQCLVLSY